MPPANSPSQQNVNTPAYLLPPPNQSTTHAEPTQSQLSSLYRAEELSRLGLFIESRENALRAGGLSGTAAHHSLPPSTDAERPHLPASQIMSRTLPLPETSTGLASNYRYGARPPRRQSLYDWAPQLMEPFTNALSEQERNRMLGDVQAMVDQMTQGTLGTVGGTISVGAEDLSDSDIPARRRLFRRRSRIPTSNDPESILERAMRLRRQSRLNLAEVSRHYELLGRSASGLSFVSVFHRDMLENILVYLSRIRFCRSAGESLKLAEKLLRPSSHLLPGSPSIPTIDTTSEDIITSTRSLKATKTSWLRTGAVFKGSQSTDIEESSAESSILSSPDEKQKSSNWMVSVKITGVDYSSMTLTGTMEANGVWGPPQNAPKTIVTYLEGEIIDFDTHTLKTTNFDTEPHTDAAYWASLDPLRSIARDSLPQQLTSRSFMEKFSREWVLMRWKEKCFLNADGPCTHDTATDGTSTLTISGFYFLSMRRSDGAIQGLYYDPSATPHQELKLRPVKPVNRTFPTYQFR